MAELNFDLLRPQPTAGASFVSGMMEGQQDARAARTQDLQNQVSQLNLAKFKRDQEGLDKLSAAITAHGGPVDLNEAADAMIKSGVEHYVTTGLGIKQKLNDQKKFADIMGGGAAPAAPTVAPTGAPEAATTTPLPNPTLPTEMPLAAGQNPPAINNLAPPVAPPAVPANALAQQNIPALIEKRNKLIGLGTTQSIAAARALDADIALAAKPPQRTVAGPGQSIFDANGNVIASVPELKAPTIRAMQELGYPITPEGFAAYSNAQRQERLLTPEEEKQRVRIATASRAPVQPSAPVAVVDPLTGKQRYVSREDAIRGGMTPAAAMESIPPKEIQKRESARPAATSAVNGFESKSDKFIADLKALRDDPGLGNITGPIFGRTGSVTREGSRAQALYDKIVAKGGFQALQDLRDASKTGGALGNVSNQEGKQLVSSFAAIDRRQNADDVKAALTQAIADVEGSKTRVREAYDSTYAYKSEKPNAPAAAPKANASNIAPIYATNGKTRIQSIDGGVNWTAVGGK